MSCLNTRKPIVPSSIDVKGCGTQCVIARNKIAACVRGYHYSLFLLYHFTFGNVVRDGGAIVLGWTHSETLRLSPMLHLVSGPLRTMFKHLTKALKPLLQQPVRNTYVCGFTNSLKIPPPHPPPPQKKKTKL